MHGSDVLIVTGSEVRALLSGREAEIISSVRDAYVAHGKGGSSLPHSTFLRFPDDARNRIISLPAYLGDGFGVAGVKWIASFPGNFEKGLDRASAVLILNSVQTGRPEAILESSIISAKRTAAGAALAAQVIHRPGDAESVGLIGCGLINFEVARFLKTVCPGIGRLAVFDVDAARAEQFVAKCRQFYGAAEFAVARDVESVLRESRLVSFATTALAPHVADLAACPPGATILHVSLRDLSPEAILSADNVVDDVDHVCRAQTSVHLAEQLAGHRGFIRCTLADILTGAAPPRRDPEGVAVFSPFGLGVFDLAVGKLVYDSAVERGQGRVIKSFLPDPWTERA